MPRACNQFMYFKIWDCVKPDVLRSFLLYDEKLCKGKREDGPGRI